MCDVTKYELQVVCTSVIVTVGSFDVVMRWNETPSWFETSPTPLLTGLSASTRQYLTLADLLEGLAC